MRVTIIGAGNIGRGFLGQLFAEAGAEITFVELDEAIVSALETRRGYEIAIVGETTERFHVPVARAVRSTDREAVAEAIAGADVVATAVGKAALPPVAELMATGLCERFARPAGPLNVIVCENVIHSGAHLAGLIEDHLPDELKARLRAEVGFVTTVVSRMVPAPTPAQRAADPLAIAVEAYCILPVDAAAFVGERPPVPGFRYVDNIEALEEQKAYTHNAGHSMTAYLGHRHGHFFIWEATRDPEVRRTVETALDETSRALIARHGFDAAEQKAHVDDLFKRYRNRALGDTIGRVARQPLRKLEPDGRLIGSARLVLDYDITPSGIIDGIVAALQYDDSEDEEAVELQRVLATEGVAAALERFCGLDEGEWLAREIAARYETATKGARG